MYEETWKPEICIWRRNLRPTLPKLRRANGTFRRYRDTQWLQRK
jgi:hypothetical protein